jgi:hypothetical protein
MYNIDMLKMKIERYERALEEIANAGEQANPSYLTMLARTILDGEPTTADLYNTGGDETD